MYGLFFDPENGSSAFLWNGKFFTPQNIVAFIEFVKCDAGDTVSQSSSRPVVAKLQLSSYMRLPKPLCAALETILGSIAIFLKIFINL
jgi:hypothetical protein